MDKNMISQFIKYLLGPSLYNREIEDSKQAEETHKHVLIFFYVDMTQKYLKNTVLWSVKNKDLRILSGITVRKTQLNTQGRPSFVSYCWMLALWKQGNPRSFEFR